MVVFSTELSFNFSGLKDKVEEDSREASVHMHSLILLFETLHTHPQRCLVLLHLETICFPSLEPKPWDFGQRVGGAISQWYGAGEGGGGSETRPDPQPSFNQSSLIQHAKSHPFHRCHWSLRLLRILECILNFLLPLLNASWQFGPSSLPFVCFHYHLSAFYLLKFNSFGILFHSLSLGFMPPPKIPLM